MKVTENRRPNQANNRKIFNNSLQCCGDVRVVVGVGDGAFRVWRKNGCEKWFPPTPTKGFYKMFQHAHSTEGWVSVQKGGFSAEGSDNKTGYYFFYLYEKKNVKFFRQKKAVSNRRKFQTRFDFSHYEF